jgi:perosamine synthetase
MIPVAEPLITTEDIEMVGQAMSSGWISSAGVFLDQFEQRWAAICDMPHGIAVSNGTVALEIAIRLLGLKPGDEVIMPTFTIISTALAVIRAGGIPVLVDSDPINWQMDTAQIENKITPRTKAIMVVHIYGHPADMDRILGIARQHGLTVIEDAAEVHGAEYKSRKCGGIGDISTFSFYANKLISTGEGGMVLVRDAELADQARSLRNLCFQEKRRFYHEALGYNFRMTNLQAALGCSQLERLGTIVNRKRDIAGGYNERLRDLTQIELPLEESWAKNVYWVYGLTLRDNVPFDAAELAKKLRLLDIETRPFFLGMHEQPVFKTMGLFTDECYPVAERLARRGLYIPSSLQLSEQQMDTVASALRKALS